MIPKIIHQTWKSKDIPETQFRKKWRDSWREYHPDWKFVFWTDQDIDNFVREQYPGFYAFFNSYELSIEKVDAVRYLILKSYGGVYLDLDMECFRSINSLVEKHDLIFQSREQGGITNAIFASAKGHWVWNNIENTLMMSVNESKPLRSTGPLMLTHHLGRSDVLKKSSTFIGQPGTHFFPFSSANAHKYLNHGGNDFDETTYAAHRFTASWVNSKTFLQKALEFSHRLIHRLIKMFHQG